MNGIYDVCIIDAGPSGMIMAVIQTWLRVLKIVVLEKKSAQTIKLSITGKSRCTIANGAQVKEFLDSFYKVNFYIYLFICFQVLIPFHFLRNNVK
jgi:predicted flavoprotein YhiN